MTELERIEYAKEYVEKLAQGINPLTGEDVPDAEVINNVHISRCLFYVAGLLGKILEGDKINNSGYSKKKKEIKPFALSFEKRAEFRFSKSPISISEFTHRLNELVEGEDIHDIKYSVITSWLVESGFLKEAADTDVKKTKSPTEEGIKVGLSIEERFGTRGPYSVVLYNLDAQHFLLDNLDDIINSENESGLLQGTAWTPEQDSRLIELLSENTPLRDIAQILKRSRSSIKRRVNKLETDIYDNKEPLIEEYKKSENDPPSVQNESPIKTEPAPIFKKADTDSDEGNLKSCKNCMSYRNGDCIGSKDTCAYFEYAPVISKEEMDNWPEYGDATFFRAHGHKR